VDVTRSRRFATFQEWQAFRARLRVVENKGRRARDEIDVGSLEFSAAFPEIQVTTIEIPWGDTV
jgi:hypothetical protein